MRGLTLIVAVACLAAHAGMAQDLPGRFQTSGVAADDVLNIRAEPAAGAEVLGSYGPYTANIEVLRLSDDGRWGQVGLPEGNGWVAMRYLAATPDAAGALPRPMTCVGTEPFWSLALGPRRDEFTSPELSIGLEPVVEAAAPGGYLGSFADEHGGEWTTIIRAAQCSDGMSDRLFGWEALVFRAGGGGDMVLSGCCTLDAG